MAKPAYLFDARGIFDVADMTQIGYPIAAIAVQFHSNVAIPVKSGRHDTDWVRRELLLLYYSQA